MRLARRPDAVHEYGNGGGGQGGAGGDQGDLPARHAADDDGVGGGRNGRQVYRLVDVPLARSRLAWRALCGKRGRDEYQGQPELAGAAE